MSPAQLVALEVARDIRANLEGDAIRDAAIDCGFDAPGVDMAVDEARKLMGNLYRAAGVRACRDCGCTDEEGCAEGCFWSLTGEDLCSRCEAPPAVELARG